MDAPRQQYRAPFPRIPEKGLTGRQMRPYVPEPDLVAAANVALAVGAPLLLTGEPGCGKTDFAWAAARALAAIEEVDGAARGGDEAGGGAGDGDGLELLECYVRSDSRARDLLYHYDAVRRFGDAQHGGRDGERRAEDARNFIELQPLGRALVSERRRVVLIDEIDKAPRDLPNDLLRELDRGDFEIPEIPERSPVAGDVLSFGVKLRRQMVRPVGAAPPLVIITSNVERQLPDAFLRRCVFYHIPFPSRTLLDNILKGHFGAGGDGAGKGDDGADRGSLKGILKGSTRGGPRRAEPLLLDRALSLFMTLRQTSGLTKKPATAELLKWVEALTTVFEPGYALEALDRFAGKLEAVSANRARADWREVPALGCLLKLREDLDRVTG